MKVAICSPVKNEELYLNEWCHYYINLGFDTIYLFDNNDEAALPIEQTIDPELLSKVHIFNVRGLSGRNIQLDWYKQLYDNYGKTFDWIAFFDIDEFLTGIDNIKTFLAQEKFKNYDQILVKWQLFGDDGYIERDMSIPVHKFFKIPTTKSCGREDLGKYIIRSGLPDIAFTNCHYLRGNFESCYPSGRKAIPRRHLLNYNREIVLLNHYRTKTLKEFLDQKLNRHDKIYSYSQIDINSYYFVQNTWTQEKQNYIDKWLKTHKLDSLDWLN